MGVGAIGSTLVRNLVPDLRGEHEIIILDGDAVEERNVTPGTQWYTPDQVGLPKVEALQFNVYKTFEREIEIINAKLEKEHPNSWVINPREARFHAPDLIIDCMDNYKARLAINDWCQGESGPPNLLHIGFSDKFTFEIEWAENYVVPTDITSGMDICEIRGAAGFVASVASLGALVIEKYLEDGEKMSVIGGKYERTIVA